MFATFVRVLCLQWLTQSPGFGGSSAKSIDCAAVFLRVFEAFGRLPKICDETYGHTLLGIDEETRNYGANVFYNVSQVYPFISVDELAEYFGHFISTKQSTPRSRRFT